MRIARKASTKYKDSYSEDGFGDLILDEVEDAYNFVKEVMAQAEDGTLAEKWNKSRAAHKVKTAGGEVQEASEGIVDLIYDMSDSVLTFGGSWTEESDSGESIEVEYKGRTYTIICSRGGVQSTFFDVNKREVESVDVMKRRKKGYSSRAVQFLQ